MNHGDELLQVVERGHRNLDVFGYPERAHRPEPLVNLAPHVKRAKREADALDLARMAQHRAERIALKGARHMSIVSDLFDNPRILTDDGEPYRRAAHGTHGGVAKHVREGEPTCAACKRFLADYQAGRDSEPSPKREPVGVAQGLTTQDAEKLLWTHRNVERPRLLASLTDEERARLSSTSGMAET